MKSPIFQGSAVAIITPFKNGTIHYDKLAELIDFQIDNGTNAIVICGTTGEASTLTTPEHLAAIEFTARYTKGRVPVIAGTGSNDTHHALVMCKAAEEAGADALLIVTPYYNKATQKGLVAHYTYLADNLKTPIILYNVPGRTGVNMSVDTYVTLSKHLGINGVKEACGSVTQCTRTLSRCGDNFNVYSGEDGDIVPMMSVGAQGVISVLANVAPKETADMARYCLEGNYAEAAKLQLKYMDLIDSLFCEVNPIPVKTALNLMGFEVGELRMPLCEMEPNTLERLQRSLRAVDLLK